MLASVGNPDQHTRVELEQNKALVRQYYDDVLTGRDRRLLDQLLDASFVSHVSGGPDVMVDSYIAAVEATHAAFADLELTVEDQIAESDRVATRWRATGTHVGTFAGVAGTGRLITVTGIHVHRIAGGRLVEHWEELNLLGALRQMRAPG